MLIDATNTNIEWADPTGEEAVWLATYTTPKVGGDTMDKKWIFEVRICNSYDGSDNKPIKRFNKVPDALNYISKIVGFTDRTLNEDWYANKDGKQYYIEPIEITN